MWQLRRNTVSLLAATFNDNEIGGVGASYLIEFSTMDSAPLYVIPVILSDIVRATRFSLNIVDGNPANGEIMLKVGHYDVKVYRQDSEVNLNPLHPSVEGCVFIGDAFVESAALSEPTFYMREFAKSIYYDRQ